MKITLKPARVGLERNEGWLALGDSSLLAVFIEVPEGVLIVAGLEEPFCNDYYAAVWPDLEAVRKDLTDVYCNRGMLIPTRCIDRHAKFN